MKNNVRVEQMTSPRTGNPVPNQFKIYTDEGIYFQSYKTIIAFKTFGGFVTLDARHWDYSKTTSTYRNRFLNESTTETRHKILTGVHQTANLNG